MHNALVDACRHSIRDHRVSRQWSHTELALRVHLDVDAVRRIEVGERPLFVSEALMFAHVFGVHLSELLPDGG